MMRIALVLAALAVLPTFGWAGTDDEDRYDREAESYEERFDPARDSVTSYRDSDVESDAFQETSDETVVEEDSGNVSDFRGQDEADVETEREERQEESSD